MKRFVEVTEEGLEAVAAEILDAYSGYRVFLLQGEMGAGKTTLIKHFCRILGVMDHPSSPTFSIVNEYMSQAGPVYHMDLYRLQRIEEAWEIGVEEYLYSGHYVFMEWPDLAEHMLPDRVVTIELVSAGPDKRHLITDTGWHKKKDLS